MAKKQEIDEKQLRRRERPGQSEEALRRLTGVVTGRANQPASARTTEVGDTAPYGRWVEYLRAADLKVQSIIQRTLDPDHLQHDLVERWDRRSCEPLIVDRMRPGRPDPGDWILEGQHRRQAAIIVEGEDTIVPCWVGWIDSLAEQARTFLNVNRELPQRHQRMFQIRIADDEPVAKTIKELVMRLGLDFFFEPDPKLQRQWYEITATQALERVFVYEGPALLENTLKFDKELFSGQAQAFQAVTILGTADFLKRYEDCRTWNRARVLQRLKGQKVTALKRKGREAKLDAAPGGRYNELSLGMLETYNFRLSPDKRLYDPKKGG